MKFLFKTLVSVLAVVGQWNFAANAAISVQQCMGMCNVELGMSCTEAIEKIYFRGDCCSLKEVDGICRLLVGTNSSCVETYKGQDPCHYDEDGNVLWCLGPSVTVYESLPLNGVDEPCPESEFEIPTPETTDVSSDGCGETICPDGDELPPPENNTEAEPPSICVSLDTCLDCLSADCKWTGGSCQSMCLMDTSCFAIGEGEIPESVCPATIPDEDGWISPDTHLSPSSDPTSAPKSGETGSNTTSEHEVSSGGTDSANNATSELEISSTGVDSGSNDTFSAFAKNFTCPSGVKSKPTIVRGNICHFCINVGFSNCSTSWSYPPLSITYTPDGCGETFCPDGDELSRSVPPPENDPKAKISSISDEHETDGSATSEQEGSSDGEYAGTNATSSAFDNNFTCPGERNSKPTIVMGKSCHLCINEGFSNCSVTYSHPPLAVNYTPDGCGETICPDNHAASNSTSEQEGSSNGADAGRNATSLYLPPPYFPPPENNTEVETPSTLVGQDTGSNTTSEQEVDSNSTDAVNNATSEPKISSDGVDASSNDISLAFGKKAPFLLALGTILVTALPTFSASFI